jgi:putative FmdB family regulatory protein
MPLYEYECHQCHKVFEVMQKFSDEPLKECEICQGPVKKLMSLSGFALKGSGWYTTDYKKGQTKGQTKDQTESASSSVSSASLAQQDASSSTATKKE